MSQLSTPAHKLALVQVSDQQRAIIAIEIIWEGGRIEISEQHQSVSNEISDLAIQLIELVRKDYQCQPLK